MKYQKIFYFQLLIIITVTCLWIYFLYIPNTEFVSQARAELANYNKKLNAAINTNDQLEKLQNQLDIKAGQLKKMESKLIDKSDLDIVIQSLVKKMAAQGITVINVTPSKAHFFDESRVNNEQNYLSKLPLEMNIEARYIALGNFLDNLDSLPFWLQPEALQVTQNPKGGNNLSVILKAIIYLRTDSKL